MSHYLIACGGTGGHLSPGIAVAERLVDNGHTVELIISRKLVDSRLCAKYTHFEFVAAPGSPFSLNPLRLIPFVVTQTQAVWFVHRRIVKRAPSAVVAFGGFTSLGPVVAGLLAHVPILLHEANRVPGKAIRLLGRFATRVYLPEAVPMRSAWARVVRHCGVPLRREVRRVAREEARKRLELPVNGKVLVVFGGSQGAEVLNDWVRKYAYDLAAEGVSTYCIAGLGKENDRRETLKSAAGEPVAVVFTPFSDDIPLVLSAADLVISRAGAGSLAEIAHCRTPSILVPYPFATGKHQDANAEFHERLGLGIVVPQERLPYLLQETRDLIFNDWLLAKLRSNLKHHESRNAAAIVARDLIELSDDTTLEDAAEFAFKTREEEGGI